MRVMVSNLDESLLRREGRAGLPFSRLLRLYLDPGALFKDASCGSLLVREQARLLLQLLVGLLQFLLAALQLFRERLRLLEQVLRAHVGGDRVEHDADRFRQLVEEGLVGWAEPRQGRQLQHTAHLALEHDWQHQHV